MSKIIYRKIRTAPGVKQYLDEEKTQVNPCLRLIPDNFTHIYKDSLTKCMGVP